MLQPGAGFCENENTEKKRRKARQIILLLLMVFYLSCLLTSDATTIYKKTKNVNLKGLDLLVLGMTENNFSAEESIEAYDADEAEAEDFALEA